jgi:hypothetical protein
VRRKYEKMMFYASNNAILRVLFDIAYGLKKDFFKTVTIEREGQVKNRRRN